MTVLARVHVAVTPVVESNSRRGEHWAIKKRRKDMALEATFVNLRRLPLAKQNEIKKFDKLMVRVTLCSSHKPDDDNLGSALKHFRDETARFLGCDDGDDARVEWKNGWKRYEGKDNGPKQGVYIEFIPFADYLVEAKAEIEVQMAALGLKT